MNNDQNEEAIEAFKKINSPYASFYQAMVCKKLLIVFNHRCYYYINIICLKNKNSLLKHFIFKL